MKITKAKLVYIFLINIPVSFMLTLAASLRISPIINWPLFFINWAVGYGIANLVALFIPLDKCGKWFSSKVGATTDTFTGNIRYRLSAIFAITMVFFVFVSPSIAILDYYLIPEQTVLEAVVDWMKNILPLITIGYVSSLASDYFAYKIAHKIDPNF